jgi:hypothetical protein
MNEKIKEIAARVLRIGNLGFLLGSIFLTLSFAVCAVAQTKGAVAKIRAEVAAINKAAAKYKKTTRDVEGVSLEGTQAAYYASGRNLRKITAQIYGETYRATGEFYYQGENLIFAYLKRNLYDTQTGMIPPPKIIRVEEQRFYFSNGKLIRLLHGKKELKQGDAEFSELKDAVTDISSKLKKSYEN